jgi:RNA polymerase-binding transcription factor DksA
MDKKILAKIKESLEAEKSRLEKELLGFAKKDTKIADNYQSNFPKFGDKEDENAAEVADYSDRLSIEHTLESQLRDVNKALESIAKGDYGICRYCQKPIEEKRLMIRPTSSSCVECKKKLKGET